MQCSLLFRLLISGWHACGQVYAVDIFHSETKLSHIGRVYVLPTDSEPLPPSCGLPPFLIINWLIPNYPPGGVIGSKRCDGPGWNCVLHCRLSNAARSHLHHGGEPPSMNLLRRYMHPTAGAALRGSRLKCVLGLVDRETPSFGLVMKQMIARYNFKPFLSKTASFCYTGSDYFEIDIDIHTWGSAALTAFNAVKEKMSVLQLRAGVVIEADRDHEMPEQMLASVLCSRIDPRRAPAFPADLIAYLHDPSHHVDPLARQRRAGRGTAMAEGNAGVLTPTHSSPRPEGDDILEEADMGADYDHDHNHDSHHSANALDEQQQVTVHQSLSARPTSTYAAHATI